jgi:hypothetical protein
MSWRVARYALAACVLAVIVAFVIVPELRGARLSVLGHLDAGWLAVGVLAQGGSLFAYSLLTRSLLPARSLGMGTVFRIDLACSGLCHSVPGGNAASAALGYRLFTSRGVKSADMCFVLAAQGPGASAVLNLLLWPALIAAIPFTGFHRSYLAVGAAGLAGVAVLGFLYLAVLRGEERAVRLVRSVAGRLPRIRPAAAERLVRGFAAAVRSFRADPRRMCRALLCAACYWLLAAASLWCFIAALGHHVNPVVLFAAFGMANVAAALPVTPSGLGIIEAALPLLLAGSGVTTATAALAVLGWRLVSFWLPIPAGAVAYASLHLPRRGAAPARQRAGTGLAAAEAPAPQLAGTP